MHVRSEPGPVFGKDSPVARVNAGARVIGAIQSRLIPSVPFMALVPFMASAPSPSPSPSPAQGNQLSTSPSTTNPP